MYKKFILTLVLIGLGCILFTFLTEDARGETMVFKPEITTLPMDFQEVKTYLNNNIFWSLEYKRYQASEWTNGNQYLTIVKTWNNDSKYWKFGLILNVPVNIYSARFTFACNISILEYIERDNTTLLFNFTSNAGNNYKMEFDYSDIRNISGLMFSHGILNNHLWFRFQRNNIPSGMYYFDPRLSFTNYNTQTGYVYSESYVSWTLARNGAGLGHYHTNYLAGIEQRTDLGRWQVYRNVVFFNTSSLPDTCVITQVSLRMYFSQTSTNSRYYINKQIGAKGVLDALDYNYVNATDLYGSFWVTTAKLYNVSFSVNISTSANKTGLTTYMIREGHDYNNTAPPLSSQYHFSGTNFTTFSLWVTYILNYPPVLTNFTPSNTTLLNVNATLYISIPYVNFTITDLDFGRISENVTYVVKCNFSSGTWTTLFNGYLLSNNTLSFLFDGYTSLNRTFWINLTINDTGNNLMSSKRHFYIVNVSSVSNGISIDNSSDDWVWVSDFSLDTGELGLSIVFILFSLVFIIKRQEDMVWKPILLFMNTPIAIATGIFYLSGNTMFSTTWFIGVIIFLFGVLLSFGGLYYSLSFGRGNRD